MSNVKWTDEQLQAITQKGCNLLVAAAAGAGKTAVLVERIIRKITDDENPVDIDRLLVVTFTNAAAAEMRERIGAAIVKLLSSNNNQENLRRQLTLLSRANITTIHSFCLDVIKNNFHKLDIDPGFRIADETETTLLKMEVLEEFFEDKYEKEDDPVFLKLVECYGSNVDDRRLGELVLELYEFVRSCPWPEDWLNQHAEEFNLDNVNDFSKTSWAKSLLASLKIELSGMLDSLNRAQEICVHYDLIPYLDCLAQDKIIVESILENTDKTWDELINSFLNVEFVRLARCKKDADKDAQEKVKALRNQVKERLKVLSGEIFNTSSEDIRNTLKTLYPVIRCISNLVIEFSKRYSDKKKEKSLLDFGDLEHYCLKILTVRDESGKIIPSETALYYREYFYEILVDEYQDSNSVQEYILNMISDSSSHPHVFMVGDVKQSIYRFRQAKPELFLQKYNSYPSEPGSNCRKILLYKNFRSRSEVINSVNFIFKQIMSLNIGELDYNDNEALNMGLDYGIDTEFENNYDRSVEIHILNNSTTQNKQYYQEGLIQDTYNSIQNQNGNNSNIPDPDEHLDKITAEARMVALRINDLVSSKNPYRVWDNKLGKYRPVEYRDIVILLRTTKNWSDIFSQEFALLNIPSYADTGTGFFRTTEIETFMSLLQIIDNPMQDIPLIAVLRSQIASFTPDELVEIRNADKNASFYVAMNKRMQTCDDNLSSKISDFLTNLDNWRKKSLILSTEELIWYLYNETGYYSYVALMPGGIQRQNNLLILLERARQYEKTSYRGLFNFINFIDKLKSRQGDMGSAKMLGENENVVRIMSIHKSKGLEFPVVFVSGCGKQFNMQDTTKSILLHQELGFGPDFIDLQKRISYPTIAKHAISSKLKFETLSEEMRILYVALTRAREKLIITASVTDLLKSCERWCSSVGHVDSKLPEHEVLRGRSFIDWICLAVSRHQDLMTIREISGVSETVPLIEDESSWQFRVWHSTDLEQPPHEIKSEDEDILAKISKLKGASPTDEYSKIISKRLDWSYPYRNLSAIPAKMTVTELKRRINAEMYDDSTSNLFYSTELIKRPSFMEKTTALTPAEKGTVLHFVMQHLDLERVSEYKDINNQLESMIEKQLITEEESKNVNIEKILIFMDSPLGKRMRKSDTIKREIPFTIELPVESIKDILKSEVHYDENILLQGVIDCFFEEDGKLVLIDYKTDYVAPGGSDAIKEKYSVQMEYYRKALEKLTGKQVKESYIYLFWNGETIKY